MITTMHDERGRGCVGDFIRKHGAASSPSFSHVFPVGRLDAQTGGLLLLTSDGELARRLLLPSHAVERQYRVCVGGVPSARSLQRLRAQQVKSQPDHTCFELTLTSGANREIRRACAREGMRIISLERIAYGPISLDRLRAGEHRVLSPRELRQLKATVGEKAEKGLSRAD